VSSRRLQARGAPTYADPNNPDVATAGTTPPAATAPPRWNLSAPRLVHRPARPTGFTAALLRQINPHLKYST